MKKPDSIFSILRRTFRLLNKKERRTSLFLLFGIFANSLVEILGLAVVVPIIGLVIQPESIHTNSTLNAAFQSASTLGIDTTASFLIVLCVLMIGAFLFKAVFSIAINLLQARFSYDVAHRLSGQMWTYHFSKSLEKMRGSDSGRVLSEINGWPLQFANSFMIGGLMILTEISVIGFIAFGLLIYNPIVVISISILLGFGALLIRNATKHRLESYSNIRKRIEPLTNTLINNAVRGILEIITFQASDAVRDLYLRERRIVFRVSSNTKVMHLIPAKLYEVLAVIAVAGSIVIALLQGTPDSGFLQLLSLMAISAYRVMPSMSRLNGTIMQMRGQKHVLAVMESGNQKNTFESRKSETVSAPCKAKIDLRIHDLELTYQSLESPVIANLNHSFAAGKIHGIVGPSGSGKSTLINALLGLHEPRRGDISVWTRGEKPKVIGQELQSQQWLQLVGYLGQHPFLFKGTVLENLSLRIPGIEVDDSMANHLIDELKLRECLGQNPLEFELQEGGSNLSGGQQQRLALLRAMQVKRPVLILDEATSALDPELRNVVFKLLRERALEGSNVILVTHDSELASQCDDVLDLGIQKPFT